MLFNSPVFIFYFLPTVLLLALALRSVRGLPWMLAFVTLASLFFYSYTRFDWLYIILASIGVNYIVGHRILRRGRAARFWLIGGLTFNLGLLFFFKYFDFFALNVDRLRADLIPVLNIALPIGISFYTFQQIAFLVDAYRHRIKRINPLEYAFFIAFFPQLIAGPIVHHSEIFAQFRSPRLWRLSDDLAIGSVFFLMGLVKKVLLADTFAQYASPVFGAADAGLDVGAVEAWLGTLAYTLQIYFDFSGYSDMAIGLGRMFGIKIPINFSSPYKSRSIIEFWRRWHITLSRFLRDYLYIAMGGNRKGELRRFVNLFLTMLLGGIWHGAGWGFVFWGALHGLYLIVNHLWRWLAQGIHWAGRVEFVAWPLVLFAVIFAWVPFRAVTLDGTLRMWGAMFSLSWVWPASAEDSQALLLKFVLVLAGFLVVLLFPNSNQIAKRVYNYDDALVIHEGRLQEQKPALRVSPLGMLWALALGMLAAFALALNNAISEFIYFQF